ncbi:MAG: hypothetical protein ABI680_06240 [Chthoniobacteraceae bacterium]
MIRARPFGRPGDVQEGIDLLAEMRGGGEWDFQCKHVKSWTPEQTRKAIAAYRRDAERRFLLVTCDVSEECRRVIADHSGWALWDAREINRRFRELGAFRAAPILFTHFGPGWAEAFFGITGTGPFIGAEAKFAQQLREGSRFHHRLALVGRETQLQQLDDFAESEKARVFLLIGRGGLGKSRLLLEWSRRFQKEHPDHTLRFVFDKNADFAPALQVAPEPLVLIFDDAHRLDEVRRALFPDLPRRSGIKLVLALRPGPLEQVMQELLGSGFDTTDIITAEPMKPLTGEQAMSLVDSALKSEFHHLRHYLRAASLDCPLIAIIGAELINAGALVEADLRVATDVRTRVFASLLDDARAVRAEFGSQETDDFLRLLALLGPVKLDAAFFEKAAPFVGIASADRVSHLRDELNAAGLLLTTGAGTRVTPDLLSDHLAYDACYDAAGKSRTFAERLLVSFSAEDFPKLMQHLAEAEWQAMSTKPDAASVVKPLWDWFRARFEQSTFFDRGEQIQQWGNISHLQPERTLQLAELALSLTTAPAPEHPWHSDYFSYAKSLTWLPKMVGPVAEHHPEYLARVFDILWNLGNDDPDSDNNQSHPLSVMHDVIRFKHWKRLDIANAALDWIQRMFACDEWLHCTNPPAVLFERWLQPLFATSVEVHWSSGRTFLFNSLLLHLENSAGIRERVRALCRSVLDRRDARLAIQLIPTVEKGCDIARLGVHGEVPEDFRAEWNGERLKCLSIFEEMARGFPEPLVHFQIRRALMRDPRYGKDSRPYRDACRDLVKSLPNPLDFRIARVAFGNDWDEFDLDLEDTNRHAVMRAKWETLNRKVADDLHAAFPSGRWFEHLAALDARWRTFRSYQPNFRRLIIHLSERRAPEALAVADRLLDEPGHPLADTFDAIAMPATKTDVTQRLTLIRAAANAESETLRAGAVACCAWWRRDEDLPEPAWQILESLAPRATPLVAERIATFVWWNDKKATIRDWRLLVTLPFAPDQAALASSIAARAAELIAAGKVQPDVGSVSAFISRFEALESVDGHQIKNAFGKLAKAFPVDVFLALWRRNQARKSGNSAIKSLPYDFHRIPFREVMNAPEVAGIIADFERRALAGEPLDFDELRLLRRAIAHSENPSAWLESAVQRANSEEHLNLLRQLGSEGGEGSAALSYPQFAKALLLRAREISPACHDEVFSRLLHLGGGRSSTNHEPDAKWKSLLEAVERLAHQHAADPELGPLFAAIAKHERSWIDSMRSRHFDDEDE